MSQKIVVGYDDSRSAQSALEFAIGLAKAQEAELVVAHVLSWSPYSFLTPEELEVRHKRRREELERAEKALLAPVVKQAKDAGVSVSTVLRYGHVIEVLCDIVKEEKASQVVVGRTGQTALTTRLFGSVAGGLAQAASVPVTIIP